MGITERSCSKLTIYGKKGSYAADYAKKAKIKFSSRCKIPALKGITYTSGNVTYKVVDDKISGKSAFKGINKKATIVVPKAKYSAYSKLLKKAGVTSSMKIKKK